MPHFIQLLHPTAVLDGIHIVLPHMNCHRKEQEMGEVEENNSTLLTISPT